MTTRGHEMQDLVRQVLRELGIVDLEFSVAKSGKAQVTFEVDGQPARFCFSRSPSKSSFPVARQQLRKLVRAKRGGPRGW